MQKIIGYKKSYIFDNLNEALEYIDKDKFMAKYGDYLIEDDYLLSPFIYYLEKLLDDLGFDGARICYDLSYTQGRGASFTGYFNYKKDFKETFKKKYNEETYSTFEPIINMIIREAKKVKYDLFFKVDRTNYRYCHSYTVEADNVKYDYIVKAICRKIETILDTEYDRLQKYETVLEFFVDNQIAIEERTIK